MFEIQHKVQYYETDQMKVVHHSNYVRWLEEARIGYLDSVGVSYAELEPRGIISPVLEVHCRYRAMTRFGETVTIQAQLVEMTVAKYRLLYRILGPDGSLRADGETVHCFVDPKDRVITLKRADPALFQLMREEAARGADGFSKR